MRMSNYCPDAVVLRSLSNPIESLQFEVRDLANGELLLKEPPSRIASWLKACGYKWVYGSSGVWKRKAEAEFPEPSSPPGHTAQ